VYAIMKSPNPMVQGTSGKSSETLTNLATG